MQIKIITIALLVVSFAAHGQVANPTPPPPPTPSAPAGPSVKPLTGDEASYLQQEAELVRRLRLADLRAQIAEQERRITGESGGSASVDSVNLPAIPPPLTRPGSGPAIPVMPMPTAPAPQPAKPFTVVSIWGVEGSYVADILAGGMRVSVQKGDALPSGWRVHEVLRTGIIITKGRKRETLVVGG